MAIIVGGLPPFLLRERGNGLTFDQTLPYTVLITVNRESRSVAAQRSAQIFPGTSENYAVMFQAETVIRMLARS